ncbi:MAG: histidinol dehydrogenase, partial [Synergistota bacterium]|nr:histidinol dehydrogenase [Synergistota bacterium]
MEYIKKTSDENAASRYRDVSETVREIIESVRVEGIKAIERFSRRFDGYSGAPVADPEDIALSIDALPPRLRSAIENAAGRVRAFHRDQKAQFKDIETETSPGVRAGLRFVPVDSVAVYVPGGRYPLPTTAFMTVIPAVEAGVRRIAAFSPPSSEKGINETVLATLGILGVTEILCVGGAQSVAAAALGFEGFDPVDMFAGPGNAFVTEAKRQLSGVIGI